MSSDSTYTIETTDLEVGAELPFDLRDPDGNTVHRAGLPVTQRLLDRLVTLGIHTVTVKGTGREVVKVAEMLKQSYDSEQVAVVTQLLEDAKKQLGTVFRDLVESTPVSAVEIQETVAAFARQLEQDTSCVLGILAGKNEPGNEGLLESLANRSVRMSYFAVANAMNVGLSEEGAIFAGTLAMLADISFLNHPDWFDSNDRLLNSTYALDEYRNHSVESADILQSNANFNEEFIESMSQIHELSDGSGFPHGLTSEQISTDAKIVNLVDMYVAMTEDGIDGKRYMESDVLAYFMNQASLGRFDKAIVRGFIKTFSLYPIGVQVQLDDNSIGAVIRTNTSNPFQPVVKICDAAGRVKDLSVSPNFIVGPAVEQSPNRERIGKSQLDEILWLPDNAFA